jgi:hypothetical protein
MKKYVCYLIVAILSMLAVGCSSKSNPVAINNTTGTSVGTINIIPAPAGMMRKELASAQSQAAYVIVEFNGLDTIKLNGQDTAKCLLRNLVKTQSYQLIAFAMNDSFVLVNQGHITFTVPDADTFTLTLNLPSQVEDYSLSVPIAGTPAAGADSVVFSYYATDWSPIVPYTKTIKFTPGTMPTVNFNGMFGFEFAGGTETFVFTVCVYDTSNEMFEGSGTAIVSASVNTSLNIPLTKYVANAAVAKSTIVVTPSGSLSINCYYQ